MFRGLKQDVFKSRLARRIIMEVKDQVRGLRESTGMNRKEFCKYFGIPYRTMTDWELGNRTLPPYVLRMMEYQVKMEKLDQHDDK